MTVTLITAGALGLLLVFLSSYVISGRSKFKVGIGDGGNAVMHRRMRAQANFIEHMPLALILVALIENAPIGPPWVVETLGVVLVVSRILHAQGLIASGGFSFGRFVGTSGTLLVIAAGAVLCLGRGLGAW